MINKYKVFTERYATMDFTADDGLGQMIHQMMNDRTSISQSNIYHNFRLIQNLLPLKNISVNFEGAGDSGCQEGIEYETIDSNVTNNQVDVLLEQPIVGSKIIHGWSCGGNKMTPIYEDKIYTIKEVIESICFDYLEIEHGGWENNEGAYGTITICFEEKRIYLDINVRETRNHEVEMSLVE